jgi:5'-3' exonuclease
MKKKTLAVIDADSMIYIIGWKFRSKNIPNLVKMSLDSFIHDCLTMVGATHYVGFFGSSDEGSVPNFRYDLYKEYKANRPETPPFITKWRPTIHKQMEDVWKFQKVEGMEADDAVSIAVNKYREDYDRIVVITADKDLKQIPNITHHDMSKHIDTEISEFDAHKFLGEQMLKGDTGDNIKGLPGFGPRKSKAIIDACKSSIEIKWAILRLYNDHFSSAYNKEIATIKAELAKEWEANNDVERLKNTYDLKQIDRKKRLYVEYNLEDRLEETDVTNWKEYIKTQYKLLKMLDTPPGDYKVPEVVEFNYEEAEEETLNNKENQIQDILGL